MGTFYHYVDCILYFIIYKIKIMEYIIVQTVLREQTHVGNTIHNTWENIIRRVSAENDWTLFGCH